MFHLLADITPHGFGHVSQTTAVLNALAGLMPDLRITVRTSVPFNILSSRLQCKFDHVAEAFDFGMKMHNAVAVDVPSSMAAYREFHHNWRARIHREAGIIRELKPDLLLGNVPYLSLAAARQAGVQSVGMCCLNWADIYRHYCEDTIECRSIHQQILEAYLAASSFLKVEPAMPMEKFNHAISIEPIVRMGSSCRQEILQQHALPADIRLVLVAMGGIHYPMDVQDWPVMPGVCWILPKEWHLNRPDMLSFESLHRQFTDVLTACDAVITKPGYGTFTEAAYAGVPVLYVSRVDWPEEPYLLEWLRRNVRCLEIGKEQLQQGALAGSLEQVWAMPELPVPVGDGALQAAHYLRAFAG